MYGDFSRVLDAASGRYSAVLAQQGRLLLDAELNEQGAILLDYLRQLTADLLGPFAGPVHGCGFGIRPVLKDGRCHAVRVGAGHYYVRGLRCDAPAPHHHAADVLPIGEPELPTVVSMLVWEQSVSALQAPELLDPALSPAVRETARRSQVRWHPLSGRHIPGDGKDLTALAPEAIVERFAAHGERAHPPALAARAHGGGDPDPEPDAAPYAGGYRGVENQLYRVEIHRGGDEDEATFKWSRDNGAVEFGLTELGAAKDGVRTGTLARIWADGEQALEPGDWVELTDDHWAPTGTPAPLMRVGGVVQSARRITLEDGDVDRHFDPRLHPLLRRWDQQSDGHAPGHGIPIREASGRWFELEDGVQVRFHTGAARFERGDYWLIPARTATAGVLWPHAPGEDGGPLAVRPHGPVRHLAPLALIDAAGAVADLRRGFATAPACALHEPEDDADGDDADADEEAEAEADAEDDADEDDDADAEDDADEDADADAEDEPAEDGEPVTRPLEEAAPAAEVHPAGPATISQPLPAVEAAYRLRSIANIRTGAVFPVHDGSTIGRAPGTEIHLDHPDVSRRHAIFNVNHEGVLTITDLESTNGTQVNEQSIPTRHPVEIEPGDTIQVGSSREMQLQVERA